MVGRRRENVSWYLALFSSQYVKAKTINSNKCNRPRLDKKFLFRLRFRIFVIFLRKDENFPQVRPMHALFSAMIEMTCHVNNVLDLWQ